MNSLNLRTLFLHIAFAFTAFSAFAQIQVDTVGITARYDTTEYSDPTSGNDPIYFLYTPDPKGFDVVADISAAFNGVDAMEYSWYKFNYSTNDFDSLLFVSDSVVNSVLNDNVPFDTGGYKVNMKNVAGVDTSWYAWICYNELKIGIPDIFATGCEYIDLRTSLKMDTVFSYRDRAGLSSVLYKRNNIDSISIKWAATEGYEGEIQESLRPKMIAPTEPVRFTITVTDEFGKETRSYVEIDEEAEDIRGYPVLRAVKSDFEASRALTDSTGGESDTTGQAPLRVQFVNKSENAEIYKWIFYNSVDRIADKYNSDTILQVVNRERPVDSITYTFPGTYDVALVAWGPVYNDDDDRCEVWELKGRLSAADTTGYITVDDVFMPEFMNVFTPNEDGLNDIFYFVDYPTPGKQDSNFKKPRSISSFSIKIYSRWGTKVYFYEGSADNWQGWDGKSGITNSTVKTGVYYYQAIFEGWDGSHHEERKGFIHVF